ncbi:MAG: sialidase family protein, partial [Fibrobacterota bacterium]
MKTRFSEPEFKWAMVLLWMGVLSLSVLSAERLFCGFEQAELATWPLTSSDAGDGDLKYLGPSYNQAYVTWITSESASDVTQGTRALCHEVWSSNPVSTKLVHFQASLWQDWSWLTNSGYGGGAGAWDSTRTGYGEYFGNVEWNARRFCPLVSLQGTVDRLPDSLRNWSGFDYLYIDVKSTVANIALWVYLFGKDRPSHRRIFVVDVGSYVTLRVPIREMAWAGGLDLSNTKNLRIELCNAEGPTKVFIDNIRLATADVTPLLTVVNDSTPVIPWLLTSPHQPPRKQAIPVVDVPTRVTGEIIASAPVVVASTSTGYNSDRAGANLGNAISVFDNNRIGLIGEMSGYVPWATTLATNRAWIVSTDGGATWHSDGSRTQPRVFSTTGRGSYNCWGQSDLQLRGTDYVMPMGWCGNNGPGSGFMMYHQFYKVVPTNSGWQAYPMVDDTAVPQRWSAIVTMDQATGCQSGVKLVTLPSGRLFMITSDWNPKATLSWALLSSYSDDGGVRWQFPQGRPALYTPAGSDPYGISGNSSPSYLLPYKHNQAILLYDQSGILYYSLHNGTSWGGFSSFMSTSWTRYISNGVTYMDSTIFLCMRLTSTYSQGPGLSLVKRAGGSVTEQMVTLSPHLKYGKLTLCGQRLWFTWVDTAENAIYAKKYFIRSDTWSDSVKLAQPTGKIRGTIVST